MVAETQQVTLVVYKITNLLNGKCYIGQSGDVETRWAAHASNVEKSYIGNAIQKYGVENFEFSIIDTANTYQELDDKEVYYMRLYESLSPKGYNLIEAGYSSRRNTKFSQETIEKFRRANSGANNPMYGRSLKLSDEQKQYLSEIRKGRYTGKENPFYGKQHTDSTKQRMKDSWTEERRKALSERMKLNNPAKRGSRND